MENIKRNQELLFSMDLDELKSYVPKKTETKDVAPAVKSRKRKSPPPRDAKEEEEEFEAKLVKTRATQDITNTSGVRRSARNAGKTVDYKSEVVKTFPEAISTAAKVAMNSEKKASSGRRYDPCVNSFSAHPRSVINTTAQRRKQYGHIPDIEVGQWWPTRYVCSFKTLIVHGLSASILGNHAAQTLYMRELGIVPARSRTLLIPDPLGRGSPELLQEKTEPIRSASLVATKMTSMKAMDCVCPLVCIILPCLTDTTHSTYTGSGGRDLKGTKDAPKNVRPSILFSTVV